MINSVDVVIPTFNETVRLAEAVSSCKKQTHAPERIIIVDDGSDASTQLWLLENFKSDPQVLLILAPHTSLPGVARSIGIEASSSDWIAFLDADDSWEETKLELQLDYATRNDVNFVGTNATAKRENFPDTLLLSNVPKIVKFRDLVKTNWVVNSSVLIKSILIKPVGTYATDLRVRAVEDYATWLRIVTNTELHILPKPLTNYRISDVSIRSGDAVDPRIHAFADFLTWASTDRQGHSRKLRKYKKLILKQIAKQYGN
jgi:teichuronic acid biosynthesis glycosyltransferase TuaG